MKQSRIDHKLILRALVVQVLWLLIPQAIFCQTEKLDMVTFTPPKGWTKTPKADAVVFSDLNKAANAFCVLTVYKGNASSGDAGRDFANDWKTFVSGPYKVNEDPKTEVQTGEGWTIMTAVAFIEVDGIKSLAMLTGFSGYGKTASILAISNSETYTKSLSDFLESVRLDKTPVAAQPVVPPNPSAANKNISLIGRWGTGTAGDMVSSNTVTYGSNAAQKYYQFNTDGTYSFTYSGYSGLVGYAGSFHITTQETGVYSINGDSITITPKKSQTNSNSGGLKNNPLEIVTYRWTIHYFEGIGEYALILHPAHQTNRDGGFDYVLAFPDSYSYSRMK
jgi:hypothetical protein